MATGGQRVPVGAGVRPLDQDPAPVERELGLVLHLEGERRRSRARDVDRNVGGERLGPPVGVAVAVRQPRLAAPP